MCDKRFNSKKNKKIVYNEEIDYKDIDHIIIKIRF